MNPIRIHFAGLHSMPDGETPIDLVRALRAGGRDVPTGPPGPHENKYDLLNREAPEWCSVAPLEEADVVIYAYRAQDHPEELAEVAMKARQRDVECIFFSWGDVDVPIDVPYGTAYRHSLVAGAHPPCERALPAFCADPLAGASVAPRQQENLPTVGFCGFVGDPIRRLIYRLMGRGEKVAGLALRAGLLSILRRCSRIQTNFVRRSAYFAGTTSRFHHDAGAQQRAWDEFLNNLLSTDYTVCIRGAGNFSYRLYEVLAAGRIPLFINTRCVLPFEDEIDWRRHCVWVEIDQIERAGEILADFHAALSPQQFVDLQRANRLLWEEKLSPHGFYRHLLTHAVRRVAT